MFTTPSLQAELYRRLDEAGGFTADGDGNPLDLTSGYAVSIYGFESRISARVLTETMFNAIEQRYRILAKARAYCFGAWYNQATETVCFDLTTLVADRALALKLARIEQQQAIFDFAAGESIEMDYDTTA